MKIVNSVPPVSDAVKYEAWRKQWSVQEGIDIHLYISDQCHPEQMLLFSKILFPDFVVVDDGVFLERNFTKEVFDERMADSVGDVSQVERILNYVHVYDIFGQCNEVVSDSVFLQLSHVIAFSWKMVLREKFPSKSFCVEASNSEDDYGPVITFFSVRNGQNCT